VFFVLPLAKYTKTTKTKKNKTFISKQY